MENLKGKTVWITGGRRIGQSIIKTLAGEGANIVASYRSSEKEAKDAVKGIKGALIVQCDTTKTESVAVAVKEIKNKFKKLDILILMASIFNPVKFEKISEKDWDQNFSVHVKGTFWPIQQAVPIMPKGSHIITISDRTALGRVYAGYLPYVVTKSAVSAMTRALAVELGPKGIIINSIAPGPILRPDDISPREWKSIRNESIIKHPISDEEAVEEFVQTVLRLTRVRSSGTTYPLDLGHL